MITLKIESRVSETTLKLIKKGFKVICPINSIFVFISYSDYEVEKGHFFKKITFDSNIIYNGQIELLDITQQLSVNWNSIPIGWKTICLLRFTPQYDSKNINQIPITDSWGESNKYFILED